MKVQYEALSRGRGYRSSIHGMSMPTSTGCSENLLIVLQSPCPRIDLAKCYKDSSSESDVVTYY